MIGKRSAFQEIVLGKAAASHTAAYRVESVLYSKELFVGQSALDFKRVDASISFEIFHCLILLVL